jgi:DHA1 family multidrug resistance protein-like MFS transporter
LPETSHATILLHRAQRLRRVTNNPGILAPSETKNLNYQAILLDALIKPTEIAIKDPAIAYICVYSSLVYAIYYSFFEAFPIAYSETYQMSPQSVSLLFLSIIIGSVIAGVIYGGYLKYSWFPYYRNRTPTQESCLVPALPAAFILTIGLFLFAWTVRTSIHWVVPTIGIVLFAGASFVIFQTIICYVPLSYPAYVASLFAANDRTRGLTAAGFVMFSRYMYVNLGIDKGVTVVAGLSILGILGMIFLYYYGANLRARSKFAVA